MKTVNSILGGLAVAAMVGVAQAEDIDLSKPVPKVPHRTPLLKGGDASGPTVEFTTWKSAVGFNDVVGKMERGLFCSGGVPFQYSKKLDEWLSFSLGKKYRAEGERLGIVVPEASKSVFDDKGAKGGAAFQLGATLLALDYRVCFDEDQTKGDVYAKIKWEVFSSRRQKVVYTTVVEASHSETSKVPGKKFDGDFMQAIVDNLLGDPKLAAVVASGGTVDEEPTKAFAALKLDPGPTVAGGVSKSASGLLSAVATVESGVGSGSAFYISREGYLLTNQHVVADAAFVRVRLSDGRNMVGEVLRVDRQRDVALLRTDPVTVPVLPVRREEGRVGEEVYALGSPFGKVLSGTLTRGILSAKRVLEGVPYLQSDVAINPGNSGGPLIDSEGRVLGITQLQSSGQGVNLFIPIDEALEKLAVSVAAK